MTSAFVLGCSSPFEIYFEKHPGHDSALALLAFALQHFPAPWGDPPGASIFFIRTPSAPNRLTVDVLPETLASKGSYEANDVILTALRRVDVNKGFACSIKHRKWSRRPQVCVQFQYPDIQKEAIMDLCEYIIGQGWIKRPDPINKPWRYEMNVETLNSWADDDSDASETEIAEEAENKQSRSAFKLLGKEQPQQREIDESSPQAEEQARQKEIERVIEQQNAMARVSRVSRRSTTAPRPYGEADANNLDAAVAPNPNNLDNLVAAVAPKPTRTRRQKRRQRPKVHRQQMENDEEFARLTEATRDQAEDPKIQESTGDVGQKTQRRRHRRAEKNAEVALDIVTHLWRCQMRNR